MRNPLLILLSLAFSSLLLAPAVAQAEPTVPTIESEDPLTDDAATHWAKVKLNGFMLKPGGEIQKDDRDSITTASWYPVVQADGEHLQLVIDANTIRAVVWTDVDQVSVANTGPVMVARKKAKATASGLGKKPGIELLSRHFLDEMPDGPVAIDVLGKQGWIGADAFGYVLESKDIPGDKKDPGTRVEWESDKLVIRSKPAAKASVVAELDQKAQSTRLVYLLEKGEEFHKVQVTVLGDPRFRVVGWVEKSAIGEPVKGGLAGNLPIGTGGLAGWGTSGPTVTLKKGQDILVERDGTAFARVIKETTTVGAVGSKKDGWQKVQFPIGGVWITGWAQLPDQDE